VRDRGWVEFSVYALFSPQSLIAEGTANFGRDVAFPTKTERMKFEKEVLFPAANCKRDDPDNLRARRDRPRDRRSSADRYLPESHCGNCLCTNCNRPTAYWSRTRR